MKVGLLVVVKTILYKRTIALGTNIDFRKDLRRSELQISCTGWPHEVLSNAIRRTFVRHLVRFY